MSASISSTVPPFCANDMARFAATVDLPSFSATLVTSITFFLSRLTAWDTREASFATSSLKLKLAVVLVISRPFVVFFSFVRSVLFFVSWWMVQ